jgi:serine protease AprX
MKIDQAARWPAATFVPVFGILLVIAALNQPASAQPALPAGWLSKLDPLLQQQASLLNTRSKIIVRAVNAAALPTVIAIIRQGGGTLGRALPIIDGQAAEVPHASLPALASNPLVERLSLDRLIVGALERVGPAVGVPVVRRSFGYTGSGVGVAVIDSGISAWHDDLADPTGGAQRVDQFVDFVNGHPSPYDDYGHGTHVAGIIAGNGFDSGGGRSGIAPGARLIALKVLDESGKGRISNVIAALDHVIAHRDRFNIRVVNLSVTTGVHESYRLDPLTLAAQRAVASGIVVVAAAGNNGRDQRGREHFGGITAPGNAPWVVTVGASSHQGTVDRDDDTVAPFSSRGRAAVDSVAKPDVVAPGVGVESLSDPGSALYKSQSRYLLDGTIATAYLPYLSLTGTSMAAPVVSATIALMLEANSTLTPNQVKAILQYTAYAHPGYDALTQGAGFLNTNRAVKLARFIRARSKCGGADCQAATGQTLSGTRQGDAVVWGTSEGDAVVWGTSCRDASCERVIWDDE